MRHIVLLCLAIAACTQPSPAPQPPGPVPLACFNVCSSNIECSGIIQRCPFCNFGSCSSTRPESPTDILRCQQACAPGVLPRPRWCDEGGCASVMRAP